ncbi:uncharacterized protein KZ484_026208 [Pholidichthys leucotaenia]
MEVEESGSQPQPNNGPPAKRRRTKKKPQFPDDIVYAKGDSVHTMSSLSKELQGITESVIGLQYVWEYRSPSKTVAPHYACKVCDVAFLQCDMISHVKGWKHCLKYLERTHPDKVKINEQEANKDSSIRKRVKEVATEVEKAEGRGQIRIILKEPYRVTAFKGLRSALPKIPPPPAPGMRGPPFGPRFSSPRYTGDYPPQGGPFSDYPIDHYREPTFGGYSNRFDLPDSGMGRRPFPPDMGHPGDGRDDYGRRPLLEGPPDDVYPEYQDSQLGGRPTDTPGGMGEGLESSRTLLSYLDNFRIENENDAQLVLKVTQKLTDALMEFRLRSVPSGSSLNTLPHPRMPGNHNQYSSGFSGPSRYPDSGPRYYD